MAIIDPALGQKAGLDDLAKVPSSSTFDGSLIKKADVIFLGSHHSFQKQKHTIVMARVRIKLTVSGKKYQLKVDIPPLITNTRIYVTQMDLLNS